MTATLVLPGTAPEGDWHAARRQGVTASEIAVLMGLSPYSSPFALYHQKTGDLPSGADSERMRLGRVLEPYVCGLFADRHPEFVVGGDGRELYAHAERPWQMATPDRLLAEVECADKCTCEYPYEVPGTGHHPHCGLMLGPPLATFDAKTSGTWDGYGGDGSDQIPVHYRCQVLWQMDVIGVCTGYLGVLFLPGGQFREYVISHADEKTHDWLGAEGCPACTDQAAMREEAELFLKRVGNGEPPGVDWRPATTGALRALHPDIEDRDEAVPHQLAMWYRASCSALKTAERKRDQHANRIRDHLGSARRAVDASTGQPVATRQVYDVKAHMRAAGHVDKLVPAKPKEKP